MSFLWPSMLIALLAVPLLALAYAALNHKRAARAAGFGSLQPARERAPGIRRHIPAALFLLSLAIILAALARPQAQVSLPRVEGTVILVFDVSASMGAADVEPSRMEAAKAAAREFILSQPETVKIGLVSFSSSGFTVQSPTNDANSLLAAIDRLSPTRGTSLGQGIVAALNTIAVESGLKPPEQADGSESSATGSPAPDAQQGIPPDDRLLARLPEGPYPSSVIVVLSDGENNQSINPVEAAAAAKAHGVRVDALGFGTTAGANLEVDGFTVHTSLDEDVLRAITQAAGGTYFSPQNRQDPKTVYASLTPQLVIKPETMEITALFAGAGLLMLLAGSLCSMLWFNRLL